MPTLDGERNEINGEFDLIVGENIRMRRLALGKTQVQVAEAAAMDVTKLSRIEGGQRTLTFREGLAVSHALRISPRKLVETQLPRSKSMV